MTGHSQGSRFKQTRCTIPTNVRTSTRPNWENWEKQINTVIWSPETEPKVSKFKTRLPHPIQIHIKRNLWNPNPSKY